MTVRLYAAAAEAAGSHQLSLEAAEDRLPLAQLIGQLGDHRPQSDRSAGAPDLQRVCAQSTFLINGTHADRDSAEVSPGDTVDVLPPFAGG